MSNGRLLILDDELAIGQTIKNIAETDDMTVIYSSTAEEFFRVLGEWEPTHIAIDLIMPDMDGVQVLARLGEENCQAKIIIISGAVGGRVLDAAGRSAFEHGLDIAGVLPKPFSPGDLRKMLATGHVLPSAAAKEPDQRPGMPVAELQTAIEQQQLFVVYQPKIFCDSGRLAGFEALVRWQHPQYGLIPPDQFIPQAESSGLIDAVTVTVLEQALEWFAKHFRRIDVKLSINLSAKSLVDTSFVDDITGLCRNYDIAPTQLIFELTETSAMEDPVASLDLLTRLRMKQFQLSIDDFGTGFSSMLQLVRLPFSEIKVDKSFVKTAGQSQESRKVIKSIVDLGRSLGLSSTAEGVEDAQTLEYLREIKCDLAQGYHIARPMPGNKIAEWLLTR